MSYNTGPKIVTDGLVMLVDPSDNNCWDGSSSTIVDLASGLLLTKGANTVAGSYNGNRIFAASADSGTLDTGYRYGSATSKVVDSAGSWTISGWIYKEVSSPNNWWHIYTDGNSGDILTIYNVSPYVFRTSMNSPTYGGVFSTGSDITDYGTDWNELPNGWNNIVVVYNQSSSYLQMYINTVAQPQQTGRVINTSYRLRNFYGWGSAQASYHADLDHSHTSVYSKVLSLSEITKNYNALKGRFGL